jgi:PHP family Zn ribbon phosphoesterase
MKPTITINDNGNVVTREMTDAEYNQVLVDEAYFNELKASLQEKKEQKIALLNRLEITADEAKLLLS